MCTRDTLMGLNRGALLCVRVSETQISRSWFPWTLVIKPVSGSAPKNSVSKLAPAVLSTHFHPFRKLCCHRTAPVVRGHNRSRGTPSCIVLCDHSHHKKKMMLAYGGGGFGASFLRFFWFCHCCTYPRTLA